MRLIPIAQSTRSRDRRRSTSRPRPTVEALERRELLAAVDSLRITEMMYRPAPLEGSAYAADEFEFIELANIGAEPLNISGVQFAAGVTFNFTGSAVTSLSPGERVLVVKNIAAFQTRYGGGQRIAGQYSGMLSNSMEQILLLDGLGNVILDYHYADHWHKASDGDGFSLVVQDTAAPSYTWGHPETWRASLLEGGSPGAAEPTLRPGDLLITEVLAHTDLVAGDQLEVHNRTNLAINISGWWLSDDPENWNKYRISDGKFVPAGGYLVFNQDQHFGDANDPNAIIEFGFSELGEEAHVASWDSNGAEAAYHTSVLFGATDREATLGPYERSDGSIVFVEMAANTLGAANTGPKVGPIVITEIMYNLPDTGRLGEFVELRNITSEPVELFHPLDVNNRWVFDTAFTYKIPANSTILPGEYFLVVANDPETFRATYDVSDHVRIFGSYTGNLSDVHDAVDLYHPGDMEVGGFVPLYLVDLVEYSSLAPWPTAAAGGGHSLARINDFAFGNDVVNWTASALPGGTPGRPNSYVPLAGDTNDDGRVDIEDLNAVRNNFGAIGGDLAGDANDDGRVDIEDLNAVRNNFGATAPAPVATMRAPAPRVGTETPAAKLRPVAMKPAYENAADALDLTQLTSLVRKTPRTARDLALESLSANTD